MNDYEKGFVEALQAVCWVAGAKWEHHMKNAEDTSLSEDDQGHALTSVMILGHLISDIKLLGSQVHRKQLDPKLVATANAPEHGAFWWASDDGEGES